MMAEAFALWERQEMAFSGANGGSTLRLRTKGLSRFQEL
jgi:hypothetical protein